MSRLRHGLLAAVATLCALLVTGCSLDLSVLPAPRAVSGPTYPLHARFHDALNLPLGAKVKLDGTVVGEVTSISTKNYVARLDLAIARSTVLPTGTSAQIRFSTPLGEDYVALTVPAGRGRTTLRPGATLSLASTSDAPTIEDAFAALSLLLNGGGIDQLATIVHELDRTLSGRAGSIRTVLTRSDQLVTTLNSSRTDIDRALTGLDTLARSIGSRQDVVDRALDSFPAALRVLATQTAGIGRLLTSIRRLGTVTTSVLNRSTSTLLADIALAEPAVRSISAVSDQLVPTMQSLTRFAGAIHSAAPGDYLTADVVARLVLDDSPILPRATNSRHSGSAAVRALLGGSTR